MEARVVSCTYKAETAVQSLDTAESRDEDEPQAENAAMLKASSADFCETMEAPPSSSRQPPDGDEFPDYHEAPITAKLSKMEDSSNKLPWINNSLWKAHSSSLLFRDQQSSCSVRDKIAIFSSVSSKSTTLPNFKKVCKSTDDIFTAAEKERFDKEKVFSKQIAPLNKVKRSASALCKTATAPLIHMEEKVNGTEDCNPVAATRARSTLDLPFETSHARFPSEEKYDVLSEIDLPPPRLHTRSRSLMDVSSTEQIYKKDRWNLLAEQRQKSLSKLKGLIIPEQVVEVDVPTVIDLPEIKSSNAASAVASTTTASPTPSIETPVLPCQRNLHVPCLTTPPWNNDNSSNVPKYSPAFKRRSLQVHTATPSKTDVKSNDGTSLKSTTPVREAEQTPKLVPPKSITHSDAYEAQPEPKFSGSFCLGDAPKSLESITSPTRSDCSFEYVSSFSDIRSTRQELPSKGCQLDTRIGLYPSHRGKEDLGRSEDESDNDSAVSSSQSSYISRTSPPTSPSHLHGNFASRACSLNESDSLAQLRCHSTGSQPHSQSGDNQNHRLLKPQSVEAINRKNILASAKCRSGRDLKIGSPLIQRKFEEEAAAGSALQLLNAAEMSYSSSKYLQKCSTPYEKVSDASVKSDTEATQGEISLKEENRLSANSKVDFANDHGTQGSVRNETKRAPEQTKLGVNENGFKSFPTKSVAVNSEIAFTKKNASREEALTSKESLTLDLISSKERRLPTPRNLTKNVRAASVTDLRKSFEKLAPAQAAINFPNAKTSKINSSSAIKSNNVQDNSSSSTAQASPKQDLQPKDVASTNSTETVLKSMDIIVLRPEIPGGSVGITLAGGADYETKEITVHKIRDESSAHRDGRLQKGDTVISINGKSVQGLTHKQLVALLKEPLPEVTLVVCKQKQLRTSPSSPSPRGSFSSAPTTPKQKEQIPSATKQKTFVVSLMKDVSGLGLSLEGGQDSPVGNVPLLIKKVFKGGAADKCGKLQAGDEVLLVNETDVSSMSRFEAWSVLKKLPEGITISLTVRR